MKKTVTNTAEEDPRLTLIRAVAIGSGASIEAQELRGQQELAASDVLPSDGSENPAVQALGIEWGEEVPGDELFRYAKLPAGWSKRATDHAMWSEIVDEKGEVRAQVFYKAAFYDRRAMIAAVAS